MTQSRTAAMGAWPPAWLAARLLACALLMVGLAGAVNADQAALAPLLKGLDLRDYASRTAPPPFSGRTLDARPLSIRSTEDRSSL
jgi:hypothetical protein